MTSEEVTRVDPPVPVPAPEASRDQASFFLGGDVYLERLS